MTFTNSVQEYAQLLISNGFTVYAPVKETRTVSWFHYSISGHFGTYGASDYELGHSMPIKPSRLNGSGAIVGGVWGDPLTLGMDSLAVDSVEYARIVARAENWCPFNAEPTAEAMRRAQSGGIVPRRFYKGAMLRNAEPWGIGTHYLPISS